MGSNIDNSKTTVHTAGEQTLRGGHSDLRAITIRELSQLAPRDHPAYPRVGCVAQLEAPSSAPPHTKHECSRLSKIATYQEYKPLQDAMQKVAHFGLP